MSQEVLLYIKEQNENRKLWDNHDSEELLAGFIVEEYTEYTQQLQECYITDDLSALALEIGDVLYLCGRYRAKYGALPARSLAIEREVLEKCEELDINPDDCKVAKLIRNSTKYPDHVMSNGRTYDEAVAVCKVVWRASGGDSAWSHSWLDHLAHVDDLPENYSTSVGD